MKTEAQRPNYLQQEKSLMHRVREWQTGGDTRPVRELIGDAIRRYNNDKTSGNKISTEERDAIVGVSLLSEKGRKIVEEHLDEFNHEKSGLPASVMKELVYLVGARPALEYDGTSHPHWYGRMVTTEAGQVLYFERHAGSFKYQLNLLIIRNKSTKTRQNIELCLVATQAPPNKWNRGICIIWKPTLPHIASLRFLGGGYEGSKYPRKFEKMSNSFLIC